LYGYVADAVSRPRNELGHDREHLGARCPGPRWFAGAKAATKVAEADCGKQRIASRVRGNIAIRVGGQAILSWPEEPGQIKRPTGPKSVDVDPDADPWQVSSAQ
jgi:hypothetical protein